MHLKFTLCAMCGLSPHVCILHVKKVGSSLPEKSSTVHLERPANKESHHRPLRGLHDVSLMVTTVTRLSNTCPQAGSIREA